MVMPLVVLSVLSIFIWYTPLPHNPDAGWVLSSWVKTPETVVPQNMRWNFMKTSSEEVANPVHEVVHSEMYTEALHHAHIPAMSLSLIVAGLGILLAFVFYQWKKVDVDKLTEKIKPLYNFSLNKWYFDELYDATAIRGTMLISNFLAWFDNTIVDGVVNGSAWVTRQFSKFTGMFDNSVVDGMVNLTAFLSGFIGLSFRRLQTGKVQTYIVFAIFSIVIILLLFSPF